MSAIQRRIKEAIEVTVRVLGPNWLARKDGSAPTKGGKILRSASAARDVLEAAVAQNMIVEVTHSIDPRCRDDKGSRYYEFPLANMGPTWARYGGLQGVELLKNLPISALRGIRVLHANHQDNKGNRITLMSDEIAYKAVDSAYIIIGDHAGEQVIFSWAPGFISPYVDARLVEVKSGEEVRKLGDMTIYELEDLRLVENCVDIKSIQDLTVKLNG